jgi:4-hydroxy-3-polyprenylbenzoate decarboxylase
VGNVPEELEGADAVGAFSNLRHQLGRCDDEPWYRYTFSDTDFAVDPEAAPSSNFDPRHRAE